MGSDSLGASIDLLLRGGVCALLLLAAVVLLRDHRRVVAAQLGAAFCVGATAYALCSSAAIHGLIGG